MRSLLKPLPQRFNNRDALIDHVKQISNFTSDDYTVSPISGDVTCMLNKLEKINPQQYGKTRNHLNGAVTQLSPYISRGILRLQTLAVEAKAKINSFSSAEKFFQELAWREYWQQVATHHPEWLWNSVEPYKTGWYEDDYADTLPADIIAARTDCACINNFITTLIETGYLHNHARMYLASYVVHWRRIKWQAGAKWFLYHLLDANIASNNLSWQWVASTFSHKPYIFNLDNVEKYSSDDIDTTITNNQALHGSYEALSKRLFPHKENA